MRCQVAHGTIGCGQGSRDNGVAMLADRRLSLWQRHAAVVLCISYAPKSHYDEGCEKIKFSCKISSPAESNEWTMSVPCQISAWDAYRTTSISTGKETNDERNENDPSMGDGSRDCGVLQLLHAHGGGNRALCLRPASVLLHGNNLAGCGINPQIPLRHGRRNRTDGVAYLCG